VDVNRILELFVASWCFHDILIDAHPNIGSINFLKLFRIFVKIIECGGQVLFETRVADIL
jgi:uncharacterized FAD-dependent dehydrogenase